jgi:hypothetical protein
MSETITVDVPRMSLGNDLTEALAARGLHAELVETNDDCALQVRFADGERARLVEAAVHAIETYLADQALPLVVQQVDGGAVVRPPGD